MKHAHVEKLVLSSSLGMLAALGLMVLSLLSPKPIYLVLAMSVGQGVGLLALALYLLAIALDLQKVPRAAPAPEDVTPFHRPHAGGGSVRGVSEASDETKAPR